MKREYLVKQYLNNGHIYEYKFSDRKLAESIFFSDNYHSWHEITKTELFEKGRKKPLITRENIKEK